MSYSAKTAKSLVNQKKEKELKVKQSKLLVANLIKKLAFQAIEHCTTKSSIKELHLGQNISSQYIEALASRGFNIRIEPSPQESINKATKIHLKLFKLSSILKDQRGISFYVMDYLDQKKLSDLLTEAEKLKADLTLSSYFELREIFIKITKIKSINKFQFNGFNKKLISADSQLKRITDVLNEIEKIYISKSRGTSNYFIDWNSGNAESKIKNEFMTAENMAWFSSIKSKKFKKSILDYISTMAKNGDVSATFFIYIFKTDCSLSRDGIEKIKLPFSTDALFDFFKILGYAIIHKESDSKQKEQSFALTWN